MKFILYLGALLLAISSCDVTYAQTPSPMPPILDISLTLCLALKALGMVLFNINLGTCAPAFSAANPMFADQRTCELIRSMGVNPAQLFVQCPGDNANFAEPFNAPPTYSAAAPDSYSASPMPTSYSTKSPKPTYSSKPSYSSSAPVYMANSP